MSFDPANIRAVLFDCGQVLSGPPDPAAWQRLKQILSAEEEPFQAAYWRHRHDYDRGTLNAAAYWRALAADLGGSLSDTQILALNAADVDLWIQPNQPMIDWAASLRRRGLATGILSNIGDAMEAGILSRLSWLDDFTHHTFSHRLLIAKPEPAIYLHAAHGLQLPPAQILFVDDREENITSARDVGMAAVHYPGHAAFLSGMQSSGLAQLL